MRKHAVDVFMSFKQINSYSSYMYISLGKKTLEITHLLTFIKLNKNKSGNTFFPTTILH